MNKLNRICIINAGRNGTTWVAMTLMHLLPTYTFCPGNDYFTCDSEDISIIRQLPNDKPWILHCNWYPILRHIPSDALIIIPYRRDEFRVVCSEIIAETTGEWGSYTITQFTPFYVNPEQIKTKLNRLHSFQVALNTELERLNNTIIRLSFDEMLASPNPILRMKDILKQQQIESFPLFEHIPVNTKNPLNHSDVILNYHELGIEFKDYIK